MRILAIVLILLAASLVSLANSPPPGDAASAPAPERQTQDEADKKSAGCVTCHTASDRHTMHANPAVVLGCADCHGGNVNVKRPDGSEYHGKDHQQYLAAMSKAHVLPRFPLEWNTPASANPQGSYTLLNRETPAFVRFINPSDYRVARESCGACHLPVIQAAERSLMATGAMLWNGAAYNNGILDNKRGLLGEAYTRTGEAATLKNPVPLDDWLKQMGVLSQLYPLPAWETVPPADVFRVFERGGRVIGTQFPEVGLPNSSGKLQMLDEPGRPDIKQSNRGPGTGGRIAVPLINIAKTRLNDPLMWFLGTNDQPGDYRSSGCAACHVVYANDRNKAHSGPYAKYGNDGKSITVDPTIPKNRSGHPLKHEFTRSIPSSQCMICHMHQPNIFVNSFYGFTMWDYESDAPSMWPQKQRYPTDEERRKILERNPEGAAVRGKWGDLAFLKEVSALNPTLKDTQFADYHGHGWNFRAIFKRDRKGTLLDKDGNPVADDDPNKFNAKNPKQAVHLTSIHLDVGMHCADCHFAQDSHGNGHIYGEVAAAIEIECADCHGKAGAYPTLFTSGPAARPRGTDMSLLRTPDGRKRFEWKDGKLYQRSVMFPDKEWEMSLVKDSVNPRHPRYNAKAARAKLVARGDFDNYTQRWGLPAAENRRLFPERSELIQNAQRGQPGVPEDKRAHGDDKMTCQTCHTSWTTSCSGCHLPIEANEKTERKHYEGGFSRNYATYNPQVVRDDMFLIGRHSRIKGDRSNGVFPDKGKITPIRSSSALVLSSTNANREKIYIQQAPTSSSGFSSQAFAPHYPHTERKTETKTCSDCHVSADNDNNAIMGQLLGHGTGYIGLMGYNAWVGEEKHIEAVQVTEWEEPQAVIGSYLHRYAYPDWYAAHLKRGRTLPEAHEHTTVGAARCVQLRGEYLYVAEGAGGMRVYDVASIANKGVSQRIISAPFSALGHNTHIPSKQATCVALPTTQPIAPFKNQGKLMREDNQEQPFHPIYNYALITDAEEGLILVDVNTLQDGDPRNNFLKRALTWNANGVLRGARHITVGGSYAYITAAAGMVIVNLKDPLKPVVAAVIPIKGARASALQFRYLAVTDDSGLRMIDVSIAERAKLVESAFVPLADADRIHLARTYAYVAGGREGLVIIDIEKPEQPRVYMKFTAGGVLNDVRDVTVASTNASAFAYVADGRNGLRVIQLTAPDTQPKFYGFSPDPKPQLIATRRTRSPALSLSRALERDRAVDETGGQVAVFGRIGSRPLTLEEQRKMYLKPDATVWTVRDNPDPASPKP